MLTVDTNFISELAKKLVDSVPGNTGGLGNMRQDLERNFKGLLTGTFERLDLVTREEFDVQRHVLERTREKLEDLEAELARFEARLQSLKGAGDSEGK